METLNLRSKSPSTFIEEKNTWTPMQKEAIELSIRKRNAVLNMIGKVSKIRIFTSYLIKLLDLVSRVLNDIDPSNLLQNSADFFQI